MKLFDETTGWDAMRRDVRYSCAMLKAARDQGALVAVLAALLTRWEALEAERLSADDALVDANAGVAWTNNVLDGHVKRFGVRLLAQCDNNRGHATYVAYFKDDSPGKVADLALEAEIERIDEWENARVEFKLDAYAGEALADIDAACVDGRAVIAAREDVQKRGSLVALRIDGWRNDANIARRKVEVALDEYALKHNLPRDWSAQFFMTTPRPARKTTAQRPPAQPGPAQPAAPKQTPSVPPR